MAAEQPARRSNDLGQNSSPKNDVLGGDLWIRLSIRMHRDENALRISSGLVGVPVIRETTRLVVAVGMPATVRKHLLLMAGSAAMGI
jgi:hypothetical protein